MRFFEVFQPGLEYLRREKDRYKMLVSKPTHGGGAPLGIDLDAGVAKIRIPARAVSPAEPDPGPDVSAQQPSSVDPSEPVDSTGPDRPDPRS